MTGSFRKYAIALLLQCLRSRAGNRPCPGSRRSKASDLCRSAGRTACTTRPGDSGTARKAPTALPSFRQSPRWRSFLAAGAAAACWWYATVAAGSLNPVFINLTGGSIGWQFGAQETDIVLVFTTKQGIEGIADGKVTLGAGASVAAGALSAARLKQRPATNAEVFAYSRSRGLFLGVALDGTVISIDNKSNRTFYKKSDVRRRRS